MTAAIRKTADYIIRQSGYPQPRMPPIDELADLAHAYIALAGTDDASHDALGGEGQIYVSERAAREYAAAVREPNVEIARQELTAVLLEARQHSTDLSLWRARSRSSGLDISARVDIQGKLLVVTQVSVRDFNTGGRRQ